MTQKKRPHFVIRGQNFATQVADNINDSPKFSVGGELGGLGNDFVTWSLRGRVSVPF